MRQANAFKSSRGRGGIVGFMSLQRVWRPVRRRNCIAHEATVAAIDCSRAPGVASAFCLKKCTCHERRPGVMGDARILSEGRCIDRVVYYIRDQPPAMIEWECEFESTIEVLVRSFAAGPTPRREVRRQPSCVAGPCSNGHPHAAAYRARTLRDRCQTAGLRAATLSSATGAPCTCEPDSQDT